MAKRSNLENEISSIRKNMQRYPKLDCRNPAFEEREAIAIAAACYYVAQKFLSADYRIFESYKGKEDEENKSQVHKIDKNHYYFHPDYVKMFNYQAIHQFQIDEKFIYEKEKEVVEKLLNWNILRLTMYDVQELYIFMLKYRLQVSNKVLPNERITSNKLCPTFINFLLQTEKVIEKLTKTLLLYSKLNEMETTMKVVAFMHFIIKERIGHE
jgi:hypothetical protein